MSQNFLQSMIFCEDLRVEMSGREIAIGVYNGTISVPQIPFVLPTLIIRLELNFYGVPTERISFRIDDPAKNHLFEQTAPVHFNDWNRPGSLAFGIQNMILPLSGEYAVYLKFGGDWVLGRKLFVEKFDPAELRSRLEEQMKVLAQRLPT